MKMRRMFEASSFFVLLWAGCSGAQLREPTAPIALGDWCQVVSSKVCDLTARACFNGMPGVADGCKDTEIPKCLAGHDPQTPSGRTGGDLNTCLAKLAPLSCAQLGAGRGSSGELAICTPNIDGSASAPPPPAPPAPATPTPAPSDPTPPIETPSQPRR